MPRSSKIFRIFVSSTFSDLKHERTVLQRHVFPELQRLCESFGAKFQAIDLRWGVSEEAQLDHKTLDICLNELQRCKELSPRPNFLILLGNRYGWRPIPAEIPKVEFEKIITYYQSINVTGSRLLREWYKEDNNRLPVSYCLQTRQGKYRDLTEWNIIEQSLRLLFDHAIQYLSLEKSEVGRYLISATEHEIQAGAFQQEDANEHVFAFFRELQGLPINAQAADYQDMTSDGNVNEFAKKQLGQLKEKIYSFLPEKNIKQYAVDWNEKDIDTAYLVQFCQDVINQLKPVIEKECRTIEEKNVAEIEKARHRQFGMERARNFIGRDLLFSEIDETMATTHSPIVVWGESGSGKTAFMAELSNRLSSKHKHGTIIQRFIGASAFGTNTKELLESILVELLPEREQEIFALTELEEILELLLEAFINASKEKPCYLIIDALDHLSDDHILPQWFLKKLPSHVHWVVSVAEDRPAFPLLKGLIPEKNLFFIGPLEKNEGRVLLEEWLTEQSRTLQTEQFQVVMKAFEKCPLPLFLKLAYEEARLWKSYTKELEIQPSIAGIIGQFLRRISDDSNHGEVLVRNVLGFFAASKSGLEETELLELLSGTEDVMTNFRKRAKHEYIENHLPPVIWVRLLNDLEPYLIEKRENGSLVYGFYHRQLETHVKEIYLTDDFHQRLADYFNRKPTFLDEQQTIPHRRKTIELPFQLYQTKDAFRFENVLVNLEFIQGKITAMLSQDLLYDFSLLKQLMNEQDLPSKRVEDMEKFCRIRHTLLLQNPGRLKLFALQMPHSSFAFLEAVRWHEERGLPYIKSHKSTGNETRLIHAFDSEDDQASICRLHPNGEHLVVISDQMVKVWNVHTGEEVYQFHPQLGMLTGLDMAHDALLGTISGEDGFKIFDLTSYTVQYERKFKKKVIHTTLHTEKKYVAVGDDEGNVWLIDFKDSQERFIASGDKEIVKLKWHPTKLIVAIWYSNQKIHLWDVEANRETKVLYSEYQFENLMNSKFWNLSFDHESDLLYASQDDGLTVWDTALGVRVNSTVSLPKGNHVIKERLVFSVLYNRQLKVWDLEGYSHYSEEHQHFHLHQDADVHNGLLAVLVSGGRILIWDLNKLSINYEEAKIEMLDESVAWVLAPVVSEIFKEVEKFMGAIFRPSLSTTISEKLGNGAFELGNMWDDTVLSVNVSPKQNYIATGHLGQFLQIKDVKKNAVTQFKPAETAPILYVDWSHDESLVFYGTTQRAWVMNAAGRLKKTIKGKEEIVGGNWSPAKKQLLLLDREGTVELFDFEEDWSQQWSLDVKDEPSFTASWNNSGQYFTICYHQTFLLYEVTMKSEAKLILKGESTEPIHRVVWSPDDHRIAFIDTNYEIVFVSLLDGEIQARAEIIELRERDKYPAYYQQIMTLPSEKLQSLETLSNKERGSIELEQYIVTLPFRLLVKWHEKQNKIAFSYGNWVTVLMLDHSNKTVNGYVNDGVYDLRWEEEDLCVVTGDKLREERYSLVL